MSDIALDILNHDFKLLFDFDHIKYVEKGICFYFKDCERCDYINIYYNDYSDKYFVFVDLNKHQHMFQYESRFISFCTNEVFSFVAVYSPSLLRGKI